MGKRSKAELIKFIVEISRADPSVRQAIQSRFDLDLSSRELIVDTRNVINAATDFGDRDRNLPDHFWSRAHQLKSCLLDLDIDPARIEKAELHVVTWTGGTGTVKEYLKLNGVHYSVAEGDKHVLEYSRLPVESKNLRRGLNRIELLSDAEHHGIEVIYPGPALMVRYR